MNKTYYINKACFRKKKQESVLLAHRNRPDRLIQSIVERLVDDDVANLVLVDLGRESLIHDSAARVSVDNQTLLRWVRSMLCYSLLFVGVSPRSRHYVSPVFPDGPTETGHNGSASAERQGQKSDVGALPGSFPLQAPYGLCVSSMPRVDHSSGIRDLLFRSFSSLFTSLMVYRCLCTFIISALPADFDRQFDYGCHSRSNASLSRDFSVYNRTPLFRAAGGYL